MWLASRPVETIFSVGHLSRVTGVLLDDGRRVTIKVRPMAARLQSCAYVQQHLWHAGFPCPEPLVGPVPFDGAGWLGSGGTALAGTGLAGNAEMIVDGGAMLSGDVDGAVDAYAGLLARLVRLAPPADDVRFLAEAPPWTGWDHGGPGVWPPADDRADDLNASPTAAWLDDLGRAVQKRLGDVAGARRVVGHGDWEAQNLRWHGLEPVVVHDWDSVIAAPEPVVVGLAAAVWPAGMAADGAVTGEAAAGGLSAGGGHSGGASVAQTEAFIESYQRASGRAWSRAEVQVAWAAGLWVRAFNAKKASLDGLATLARAEAAERSRRAGLTVG